MDDKLPQPSVEQTPPPKDLPQAITSVDEQIAKEFSAMHPFIPVKRRSGLSSFVGYVSYSFANNKIIAIPVLVGFVLIAGTVTTLALSGGSSKKQVALSGNGQSSSTGTSTRDDSSSSGDGSTGDETGSDDEAALSDDELADSEITDDYGDDSSDLLSEDDSGYEDLYDPEEPLDDGGPTEDPSVPDDPDDTTPPTIPDTPTIPPQQPALVTALFTSYNYASWKPATGIDAAIRTLSDKGDVIGLQEFGPSSHRDALLKVIHDCTTCGYAIYLPSATSGGSTPIIWKKSKFQILSKGSVKVYDGQTVEALGGSTHATAKYIVWVRLKHVASSRVFFFVNSQLIAGVEKNGAPDRSMPKRLALYQKHINLLASKTSQFQQNSTPVIVTGDFNVNYNKDRQVRNAMFPYAKMDSVNTWANWRYLGAPTGGSYGDNLNDYVFASKNAKLVPKSAQLLPNYGSDHRAVSMTVQFK